MVHWTGYLSLASIAWYNGIIVVSISYHSIPGAETVQASLMRSNANMRHRITLLT